MNHRQWKKNYKKRYGYNPPAYMDKRKRRKARAQQSLPCAGISVEQITQAMETFTEAVFAAAGNICDALAQMFGRQAQAFNAVAEQYKDDKAGAVHGKSWKNWRKNGAAISILQRAIPLSSRLHLMPKSQTVLTRSLLYVMKWRHGAGTLD